MSDVALIIDDETRCVLVQALDLLQRVAMGQWRAVAEHAPMVLGVASQGFGPVGDDLTSLRQHHTPITALKHANASLGIRQTHRQAQVACDLWHALGGGMESRRDDRLTNARISVAEVRAGHPNHEEAAR